MDPRPKTVPPATPTPALGDPLPIHPPGPPNRQTNPPPPTPQTRTPHPLRPTGHPPDRRPSPPRTSHRPRTFTCHRTRTPRTPTRSHPMTEIPPLPPSLSGTVPTPHEARSTTPEAAPSAPSARTTAQPITSTGHSPHPHECPATPPDSTPQTATCRTHEAPTENSDCATGNQLRAGRRFRCTQRTSTDDVRGSCATPSAGPQPSCTTATRPRRVCVAAGRYAPNTRPFKAWLGSLLMDAWLSQFTTGCTLWADQCQGPQPCRPRSHRSRPQWSAGLLPVAVWRE